MTETRISRRTVLRGLGTAMALPWLEAMTPRASAAGASAAAKSASHPLRMAFLYVPNGVHIPEWTPKTEGTDFELPGILQPLAPFKSDMLVLTGLTADKARANGDGGGDHARAMSAFLTGCQPRKTDGANIRAGVSVDQYAAQRLGDKTRLSSLEIGCDGGKLSGNCDSGYSCAYSSTISWRGESTPVPKETNPKLVFERLFSGNNSDPDRVRRNRIRTSVLDLVLGDAGRLKGQLGTNDQRKLDEYLTSVRDLEQRITRAQNAPEIKPPAGTVKPDGAPKDLQEHIRLLGDLMVLAFQTDITRICTFPFVNEGSNKPYPVIGVPEGHHDLSHHGNDPKKQAKIKEINKYHTTQLAYILGKMKAIKEGDGTLLDHTMLVYGSGNSDGNRHNHDDLPILLIGKAGGTLSPGRHIRYPKETPLNNLWLSLLDRMGCPTERLGDSTGRLTQLT